MNGEVTRRNCDVHVLLVMLNVRRTACLCRSKQRVKVISASGRGGPGVQVLLRGGLWVMCYRRRVF